MKQKIAEWLNKYGMVIVINMGGITYLVSVFWMLTHDNFSAASAYLCCLILLWSIDGLMKTSEAWKDLAHNAIELAQMAVQQTHHDDPQQ